MLDLRRRLDFEVAGSVRAVGRLHSEDLLKLLTVLGIVIVCTACTNWLSAVGAAMTGIGSGVLLGWLGHALLYREAKENRHGH